MASQTIAWSAFGAYLIITTLLALRGMKKTTGMESFALGNGDMGPLLVGITLAASIASTATFVINPGFVWAHGVSALMHFGVAGTSGVLLGLILLSRGFRRLGEEHRALTMPHWIGARYGSSGLRMYFAALNLLFAVVFVVLIIKGSALVMQATLGLDYITSVLVVVGFVFSYILMGGTYAHAYTNALQGSIMLIVAIAMVASGLHLFGGEGLGFFERLAETGESMTALVSTDPSPSAFLFDSAFEVFVCGFVMSFGLVCQPHILMKSLYLRSETQLNRYLLIGSLVGVGFALVLLVGLYARVAYPDLQTVQDAVVPAYIERAFSPTAGALISVALLAAGMSTMDGILVSASTIAGNDLVLGLAGDRVKDKQRFALRASRAILVAMGTVSLLIALDPPDLVGLFAWVGLYGLVAASLVPVTAGIFFRDVPAIGAAGAAIVGPLVHFGAYFGGLTPNPGVSATCGVALSALVLAVSLVLRRAPAPAASQ
ncbi:MAG: sodium:solute symporter family protein [Myxococcota bacterium]